MGAHFFSARFCFVLRSLFFPFSFLSACVNFYDYLEREGDSVCLKAAGMSRCFPTHGHGHDWKRRRRRKKERKERKKNQLMTASFCDRTTGGPLSGPASFPLLCLHVSSIQHSISLGNETKLYREVLGRRREKRPNAD